MKTYIDMPEVDRIAMQPGLHGVGAYCWCENFGREHTWGVCGGATVAPPFALLISQMSKTIPPPIAATIMASRTEPYKARGPGPAPGCISKV